MLNEAYTTSIATCYLSYCYGKAEWVKKYPQHELRANSVRLVKSQTPSIESELLHHTGISSETPEVLCPFLGTCGSRMQSRRNHIPQRCILPSSQFSKLSMNPSTMVSISQTSSPPIPTILSSSAYWFWNIHSNNLIIVSLFILILQSVGWTGLSIRHVIMLLCVTGRHFFNVVVGSRISHIPTIPRNVLRIHLSSIRKLVGFRDYLFRRLVLHDLIPTEITNLHRTFRGFLWHVIFSNKQIRCGFDLGIISHLKTKVNSFLDLFLSKFASSWRALL